MLPDERNLGWISVPSSSLRLQPNRKPGEYDDASETTPRGAAVGTKRTRRDGSELTGHRSCVFKLSKDKMTGFMESVRVSFEPGCLD